MASGARNVWLVRRDLVFESRVFLLPLRGGWIIAHRTTRALVRADCPGSHVARSARETRRVMVYGVVRSGYGAKHASGGLFHPSFLDLVYRLDLPTGSLGMVQHVCLGIDCFCRDS